MSLDSLIMDRNVDLETLEEIDDHENHHSDQNIVEVSQSLSQKSLSNSIELIRLIFKVGEESNKGTNILVSIFDKRERFP